MEKIYFKYNIFFPNLITIMGSKQRILEYLEVNGIGKRDFSRDTGLSHTLLNIGENLGTDKLEKIISVYPELNLYWVVLGIGNMTLNLEQQKVLQIQNDNQSTILNKEFQLNLIKAISEDEQTREILTLFVKTIFNKEYAIKTAELLMDNELAKDLISSLTKSLEEKNIDLS